MYSRFKMSGALCSSWKLMTPHKTPSVFVVPNQFLPDPAILEHFLISCSSVRDLGERLGTLTCMQ